MPEEGPPQQYCLRWNNHKTNLLNVFSDLFRNEDFTDVTLVCEGGPFIKCHKMVLAASSTYFQILFSEVSCRHPYIVLKDVRYHEIQAILEYMYKGEVSITVEEVNSLLKVAETLKVKGLVGADKDIRECSSGDEYNAISTSSPSFGHPSNRPGSQTRHNTSSPNDLSRSGGGATSGASHNESGSSDGGGGRGRIACKNEDSDNVSPPHSTIGPHTTAGVPPPFPKSSYCFAESACLPMPLWPIGLHPSHQSAASSTMYNCYRSSASVAAGTDTSSPLRRKKLAGLRDTPILRTVLGQSQADSSQPISLVLHDGQEQPQSNGPTTPQDSSYVRLKSESMSEDAHSPYMDASFIDEEMSQDRGNKVMHSSSSSPQSFYSDTKGGVSSGIASYVPNQKPEWKRYKQYTRNDILSAIDAVRNGMSALQAARKFGVPSRTLYDKVKKLGITTSRPFRKGPHSSTNGAAFPYGLSGTGGAMMFNLSGEDEQGQGSVLEQGFLQHALEHSGGSGNGGKVKFEDVDRDTLSTSPPPPPPPSDPAHNLLLQRALEAEERMKASEMVGEREALSLTTQDNSGMSSNSPPPRSPSPNLIKYAQHSRSLTPSPRTPLPEDDYEDQVEDLSMARKPEQQQQQQQQQSRVIMPPMNQAQASMLANCNDTSRD